jgi:hypothetical protein
VVLAGVGLLYLAAATFNYDSVAIAWRLSYAAYGLMLIGTGAFLGRHRSAYYLAVAQSLAGLVLCLVKFRPLGLVAYVVFAGLLVGRRDVRRQLMNRDRHGRLTDLAS